jgi:hypothetical protein
MLKVKTTDGHTKYLFASDVKTVTGIGRAGGGFSKDHRTSIRLRDGELILCRDSVTSVVASLRKELTA